MLAHFFYINNLFTLYKVVINKKTESAPTNQQINEEIKNLRKLDK